MTTNIHLRNKEDDDAVADVKCPQEALSVSSDTLNFIHSLFAGDLEPVLFDESLTAFSDTTDEVGRFSVFIHSTDNDCIDVNASSSAVINDVPCGSVVSARLSRTLQTLEQNHFEYAKMKDGAVERRTLLRQGVGQYVVERTVKHAEDAKTTVSYYTLDEMEGVFPEASNLLLLRLMVQKGLPTEGISLLAFSPDMIICPVHYRSLEHKVETVGDKEVTLIGIERATSCDNEQTTWQSYFTAQSRLVSRAVVGSTINMRLCSLPAEDDDVTEDENYEKPQFVKQSLDWEEDMELNSKFLDRKDELKASHAVWMRQHPELHALVADFMQFILFNKPDNVVDLAASYFATLR